MLKVTRSAGNRGTTVRALIAALTLGLVLFPFCLYAQEPGVRRALLIGVGDYAVNDAGGAAGLAVPADLKGPANDVALLSRVLTTRFAFAPENIVTLVDDRADRAHILSALADLVAEADAGDVVYIHFSGLGSRVADVSGDESDGWDDTILPHDARMPGVADITDDELEAILGGLRTANALVVLDAGHDPMPTAAGSEVRVRAAGQDSRTELYADSDATVSNPAGSRFVLMNAAAPGQYALESPIDGGPPFGWFSWSLARALDVIDQNLSVREARDRAAQAVDNLGIRTGLRAPEIDVQGEQALLDRAVLGGDGISARGEGTATRVWLQATSEGVGRARLARAVLLGGAKNSLWAIFPPDTNDFAAVGILATAQVTEVQGMDALVRLDGNATVPEGGRAIRVAPAPPGSGVNVWLRSEDSDALKAMQGSIRSAARTPVTFVDSARDARFIVTLDDRGIRVFSPGGLQEIARFEPDDTDAVAALAGILNRSVEVAHLQALNNPSGAVRVRLGVNPIDVDGMPRIMPVAGARPLPVFRVRKPGEDRAPDNSLMMSLWVDRPAFVTVVDVGPEGVISQLFPNPVSDQRSFFPDGFIPQGTEVRIPDSLVGGSAGFYVDYEPPAGPDTLRVFVTSDPVTARRIRDYVARYAVSVESSEKPPEFLDIFLPIEDKPPPEVGTSETGFGGTMGLPVSLQRNFVDWSATSVSFWIRE